MSRQPQWLFESPISLKADCYSDPYDSFKFEQSEEEWEGTDPEWFEAELDNLWKLKASKMIQQAILEGNRDKNRLTDMVFFVRYPSQRGRTLKKGDPLSQEWLRIRDHIVRPALNKVLPANSSSKPSTRTPWLRTILPLLNRYRSDIPLHFLLGWIAVESAGKIDVITKKLNERGYFQIHPDESKTLRLDHQRLSVNPDYSVKSGIQLVRHYGKVAQNRYKLKYGTDLFWHIVKLLHWLPGGVDVILKDMRERGIEPTTWEELKQYVIVNRESIRQRIKREHKRSWDPMQGITNVDKVFSQGRQLAMGLTTL